MPYQHIYLLVNMEYETRNHSKFLLMYHVIFVCKYRKQILNPISEELKQIIYDISKESVVNLYLIGVI
jgi:putative transposase